jgi:hypothetical protein
MSALESGGGEKLPFLHRHKVGFLQQNQARLAKLALGDGRDGNPGEEPTSLSPAWC